MAKPWEKAASAEAPRPRKPWEKAAAVVSRPEPTPWGDDGQAFDDMYRLPADQAAARQMNAPNPITQAVRGSQAQANDAFAASRREQPVDADAERARVEALAQAVGEMGPGAAGYSVAPNETGQKLVQGDVNRMLPARFGAAAVNAAGPGSVNATLEIADAIFGPGPAFDFMGNPLEFSNTTPLKPEDRYMQGGVEGGLYRTPTPPEMLPTVQMEPAIGEAEGLADFGGTLAGVLAGPGKAVPKEAGLGRVAADIGAKGTVGAKAAGYGTRMAGNLAENMGYAALVGANMAPEGQRAEMAGQFAADPLTWAVGPFASAIYRGSIALKTMGNRVTPQAIQLQQAVRTLQVPNATDAQKAAAARFIEGTTPPAPDAPNAPQAAPAAQSASGTGAPPPGGPPPQVPAVAGAAPAAQPAQAVASLGEAEVWFNALPQKTRESILRVFASSGVRDRADQFAIIADLNSLPPGRSSQNAFLIAQKWGERYPSLRENLSNMGREFSVANPRPNDEKFFGMGRGREDRAQAIMDTQGRAQVNSERAFLEQSAETNFGAPSAEVEQQLRNDLLGLGKTYNKILDPQRKRRFGPVNAGILREADQNLVDYLKQPHIAERMPDWVKMKIMTEASEEMRRLDFTPNEIAIITAGDGAVLAPLFSRTAPLDWSPQLWAHLVEQYPKVAGHFLQSAYGKAIGDAASSMSPEMKAMIPHLERARGFSAADGGQGEGLLHLLEQTMPDSQMGAGPGSYQHTRVNYGDIKGAEEALDLTARFRAAAQNGQDVSEIMREMGKLSPRGKEAALSQITSFVQDSMGNKVRNVTPGTVGMAAETAPNLTQLGNENFLQALRKVFGDRGDALANDIELSRASTVFNNDINPRINSRTAINQESVRNAPNVYENPAGLDGNIVDSTVKVASMAGAGAAATGQFGMAGTLATLAGIQAVWNKVKRNKRLTNTERSLLADFMFRSRQAGQDGAALLDNATNAPPPRSPNLPSRSSYAANVAVGAAAGGTAGAVGGNGDPNAVLLGIIGGMGAGGLRAKGRSVRAKQSIIPPRAIQNVRPPGRGGARRPPQANALATTTGAAAGFVAAPDIDGDGVVSDQERLASAVALGAGAGGARRLVEGNALRVRPPPGGPKAPPKPMAPVGGKGADAASAPQKPSATVSSVPQSRTVAKVTTADGRGYEVTADVIKDRDAVVMSPAWPSNIAEDLTNAIVHQRSRNRARASGMDLANDPPRSPDWAEQNPQEWASVQKQVGERFLGMARSTPGDAHILALVDGIDVNSLGSFLEANLPAGKRLLISPANGEIAIVSKGANLPQFETWTNLSPRYNQSMGLLPPPAEWATSAAAKTPSSGNVKPLAPKPPPVKNGIGSRSLPMDEGSRMQRAREMGFDTERVAYRGINRAYDESGKGGGRRYQMFTSSESDAAEYGSTVVAAYLRKGNNLQLDGGGRNFNSVSISQLPDDVRAKLHPSIQGVARIDDIADAAQKAGYDSVTVANVYDNAWGEIPTKPRAITQRDIDRDNELLRELGIDPGDVPSTPRAPQAPTKNTDPVTIDVVFDTKNIRSKDAAFDPSQEGSSKLLAGMKGAAPEMLAGAGSATLASMRDPDTNGDGVVSKQEALEHSGGIGGSFLATTMGVGLGRRMLGNKLKGGPKPPPGKPRFKPPEQTTFAGVNAKTADRVALARAQTMEAEGATRDAIWDETGWFKGVDGKWRFEIDDSGAKFKRGDLELNLKKGPQSRVLDHPQMYEAYPDMADIKTGARYGGSARGAYFGDADRIELDGGIASLAKGRSPTNRAAKKQHRSTLLHENTHAIQAREGFARGGNPDMPEVRDFAQQERSDALKQYGALNDELRAFQDKYLIDNDLDGLPINYQTAAKEWRRLHPDKAMALDRSGDVLSGAPPDFHGVYRRLAGEAEARNVQTRDAMRLRGEKPGRPWETQDVPDDQQIVRFGGGKAESRPKPPPSQMGFTGGKGTKPPPKEPRPVMGKRTINALNQAARSLPPEVRNKLKANAALPPGARKSAAEATGDDPSIYRMAAPFQNAKPGPVMRQAAKVRNLSGKTAFPPPANPIDAGVNASLDRIERNVGPPRSLDPIAEAAGIAEKRRRAAVAEASRWNARTNTQTREAMGLPDLPLPKSLARNEQEATELAIKAKQALAAANLETTLAQEARVWAEQRKQAIIDALMNQPASAQRSGPNAAGVQVGGTNSAVPPVRPPKPVSYDDARDMADLIFDAEYAKLLDDVLSGKTKPRNRDQHHMALIAASLSVPAGIGALAVANDFASQAKPPPQETAEDPQTYMNPGDPRYVWDWDKVKSNRRAVQAIQINLNALPPNQDGGRYNLSIDAWGPKTEAALKHWQYENGFSPDGAMTAEQWELLDQQAIEGRRSGQSRTAQRR